MQITTAPKLGENEGVVYVCSDPAFEDLKDYPEDKYLSKSFALIYWQQLLSEYMHRYLEHL